MHLFYAIKRIMGVESWKSWVWRNCLEITSYDSVLDQFQVALNSVQLSFKYLQKWRFYNLQCLINHYYNEKLGIFLQI